ncbi:MAG TPA: hypothetical protein DEA96_12655 [Leptospiraceae bacterium]|nr:hypothetical protein [Spirochaetaceae bacterium]HBS05813.1 hypothetical protein [Leptospiraceae bacterium]|tara:strand:- start:51179 stop:51760 length:582 start_codon:yes stop_codon:yes gene_type:complete
MPGDCLNCLVVRPLPEVHTTESIPEFLEQCESIQKELEAFVREIPLEYLEVSGYPEGWSPAKNVKHVTNSLFLFSRLLGAPAFVLKIQGKVKRSMPGIEAVRPTNRPPRYDYGTYKAGRPGSEKKREALIKRLNSGIDRLKAAVQKRTEQEMDERKGPFGGMNLRLFAHFVLKHTVFHLQVVRSRLLSAKETA